MNENTLSRATLAAFFITILLGGFNAIGVHFIVMELPPFWGATIRFGPAAAILLLASLIFRLPLPRGRSLIGAILFGILNFGGSYAFLYWGLLRVQAGMTQVLLASVPLLTFLFAIAHRQEAFRWRTLAGALLAVGGIALVFLEHIRANVPFAYILSVILGAACFAEANVVIKNFPMGHPISTNVVGMASGALILFVISLIFRETPAIPLHSATWISLTYLILLGSCAVFILSLFVLKRWTAFAVSYTFVLMPFVTIVASAWLTGEKLSPALLVGAGLVIAGVYVGVLGANGGIRQLSRSPLPQAED
jgi:drug/metabolite transporter (DMT)-like permease